MFQTKRVILACSSSIFLYLGLQHAAAQKTQQIGESTNLQTQLEAWWVKGCASAMGLTKANVCSLLRVCKSGSLSASGLMHTDTYTQSFPTVLVFIYGWQWLRVLFYVPTLPMISPIVCDNLHFSFPLFAATSALPIDPSNISPPDSSFHHSWSACVLNS